MLNLFKITYIIFIVVVLFIYTQNSDTEMFSLYLMMGSFALMSTLLHACLKKIQIIEEALLASPEKNGD